MNFDLSLAANLFCMFFSVTTVYKHSSKTCMYFNYHQVKTMYLVIFLGQPETYMAFKLTVYYFGNLFKYLVLNIPSQRSLVFFWRSLLEYGHSIWDGWRWWLLQAFLDFHTMHAGIGSPAFITSRAQGSFKVLLHITFIQVFSHCSSPLRHHPQCLDSIGEISLYSSRHQYPPKLSYCAHNVKLINLFLFFN